MASDRDLKEFPNAEAKLQRPTKLSAFEKQRADAEAKRLREAAETEAALQAFQESLGGEADDDLTSGANPGGPRHRPVGFSGFSSRQAPPKRHGLQIGSGLKSGPGSLGPSPSAFGKKRSFQDFADTPKKRCGPGQDDHQAKSKPISHAFQASDDEDELDTLERAKGKAVARPTLRLSNLPPGTSQSLIKTLIPDTLVVEETRLQPAQNSTRSERKSQAAIIVLSQETPANEIDAAVSALQNRYLGYGYYLSLHRHLSSAVTNVAATPSLNGSAASNPFGARPVEQPSDSQQHNHHRGPQRGYAPPSSYNPVSAMSRTNLLYVSVKPPRTVVTLRLINMVVEGVIEHGPGFEALLMSRPEVQREEKWAWIWDARSEGGIWYRWKIWEIISGSESIKGKYVPLFDGADAWKCPEKPPLFEYTTTMEEFVSDPAYDSSDDDELGGEETREGQSEEPSTAFLNPLHKAKLVHLLSRLPTTMSKLRKGDIGRITTFAITHASRGVDEVVDVIVSNVEKPFSLTAANPANAAGAKARNPLIATDDQASGEQTLCDTTGDSTANLIALYIINDILSSSSTSGVRHAWRYRQLFETALRERQVFERLGLMAEKLRWGRIRAEKWRRSINLVLNLWEGWCVFPAESQEFFVRTFENPPSAKVEDKMSEAIKKGKWKAVDAVNSNAEQSGDNWDALANSRSGGVESRPSATSLLINESAGGKDVDGEPIEDVDVDGEPVEDDDVAGELLDDADIEGEVVDEDEVMEDCPSPGRADRDPHDSPSSEAKIDITAEKGEGGRVQPRKRLRAVDMFVDSDESGKG